MGLTFLRAMFDDAGRGDDRRSVEGVPARPAVLSRRTINVFALLGVAGVVYATLVPFRIEPSRTWSWALGMCPLQPGDALANVIVYVPVGLLLRLMVRRRGSFWLAECIAAVALAGGLSYLTEVCQTILAERVSSWSDVLCNTGGACLGAVLAPSVQRMVRNQHAWLYAELRERPFAAAAAGCVLLVLFMGLALFDFQPTPARLAWSIAHVRETLAGGWPGMMTGLGLNKLAAASAYAVAAFLLVLAGRQMDSSLRASVWYALSRAGALVVCIELSQLFTVSHVAEPRDLLLGWLAVMVGAAGGWAVVTVRAGRLPAVRTVLGGLTVLFMVGLLIRLLMALPIHAGGSSGRMVYWLPMAGSFDRPWNSVLSDYAESLLQYILFAGLVVLGFRVRGRTPTWPMVFAVPVVLAFCLVIIQVVVGGRLDTAEILLALLAGGVALRLDRAFFGRRDQPAEAGFSHIR